MTDQNENKLVEYLKNRDRWDRYYRPLLRYIIAIIVLIWASIYYKYNYPEIYEPIEYMIKNSFT